MKKFVSLIMAVVLFVTVIPFTAMPAFAADELTDDGEMHWELKGDTLRVWGHGNMKNFSSWRDTPWYKNRADQKVKHIEVGLEENNGISKIGRYAFAYFYLLEDIKLGEGIEFIEDYAFYCAGYKTENAKINLEIPSTVFYIGQYAFSEALGLKTVNIKSEVSAYRDFAKNNTFPTVSGGNVKGDGLYIQNEAFYLCSKLESAAMKLGVKKIGEYAFSETGLKHIYVPGTVKNVEYCAFYKCPNLESAVIDEGVETIANYAFEKDGKLSRIYLPLTLKSAGYMAFAYSPCTRIYSALEKNSGNYWFTMGDYIFYGSDPKSLFLRVHAIDEKWCSDDVAHWKTDKVFNEAHVDYTKHTSNGKYNYVWNGDQCTVKSNCRTCGKVLTHETKKGTYVSDLDSACLGHKGHYEVTFDTKGCTPQRTAACSVVLDNGAGHKMTNLSGAKEVPIYHCEVCSYDFFDAKGKYRIENQDHEHLKIPNFYLDKKNNKADIPADVRPVAKGSSNTLGEAGKDTWYVVYGNVTIGGRVQIKGNVSLILTNGYTLTCNNGIEVSGGNKLTVYAQDTVEGTMGKLTVSGAPECAAGIGSIYGSSGETNIYGGKIYAKGGYCAAGIGSGKCGASVVNIYGGFIEAHGDDYGAGIGCGAGSHSYFGEEVSRSTINIHGGTIKAYGGNAASGIGGAGGCNGCNDCVVNLYGGKITAVKGQYDSINDIGAGSGYGTCVVNDYRGKTGSVLSEGSLWIILAVAVVAVGGVATLIIVKKKKKPARECGE